MEKILLQVCTKSIKQKFEEAYIQMRGIYICYFLPIKIKLMYHHLGICLSV